MLLISAALASLAGTTGCRMGASEDRFLSRGKHLVEQKEYARALLEFKNAAKLKPKDAEPYYQMALTFLALGDARAAYANLLRATELNPKHVAAQNKLAEMIAGGLTVTRDSAQLLSAEKRVQSILAIVPDNADALSALGLTEYLLGNPDDAIKHLQTALENLPQNLRAAKVLAFIKLNQKDYSGAEEILKKAAADSPHSPEAQLALGRFFWITRRTAEAEAAFRQALSLDPKYGVALLDLARLQLSTGKKEDAEKTLAELSALPDKQYRPVHAIFLFEQGKNDEALKEFERQAKEDPNDRDAFLRLVSIYFFTKRFPDAENTINVALKKNPKNNAALLERSKLYLITAKYTEAQSDLNRVLTAQPDSAIAHYLLSKVLSARGQPLARRTQLGEALRLNPNLLSARVELAQALRSSGSAKAALDLLEQTPPGQRGLFPVLLERNWALFELGDLAQLRTSLEHGPAVDKSPDLLLQRGLLELRQKEIPRARKSLEAVLAARPEDANALEALAKSFLLDNKPAVALQTVQQYAARHPDSAALQNLLGRWLTENNRYAEARAAYTRALAADPALDDARLSMAYLDINEGNFDSARQTLEAVGRNPRLLAQANFALAIADDKSGNVGSAIAHYRKVLEASPDNVPALNNLAYHLANDTDQLDEALQYAQRAKELAPDSVSVDDTIGWALYRKHHYDPAVKYFESAVARHATALYKYHLAMAYVQTGSRQRGTQMFVEAQRMDANLPEAAATLALLKGN
jgi:putative PEP-CTERM system TPR-repeat lipoprotein